eukprot:Rhum_TRINITY_DN9268_c0_g1::Rhum_TRINITY_DN9268_c0_g1_i1::g.32612::m.32612
MRRRRQHGGTTALSRRRRLHSRRLLALARILLVVGRHHNLPVLHRDLHVLTVPHLPRQVLRRQLRDQLLVEHTLQLPGPVHGRPALVREVVVHVLVHRECHVLVLQQLLDVGEEQADDVVDVVLAQPVEHHNLVEPVDELGRQPRLDRPHHVGPDALEVVLERQLCDDLGAEVAGEDDDGVLEVDLAALAVCEVSLVEDLQQHVGHRDVALLKLVEEHDLVRAPPHLLCELSAFLVSDVAGRGSNHPVLRMGLRVLRHVQPHDVALVVEQELRQLLAHLRLAHACRPEEQEAAQGALVGVQAGARHADDVGDGA